MKKSLLAGALVLAMSTVGASASTVTYDFSGGANPAGPFSLGCDAGGALNAGCVVTFNASGVGVDGYPDLQPGQIDGTILSVETLVVSFAHNVLLESFELGNFGRRDQYQYSINGGSFSDYVALNPATIGEVVSSFAIRASGYFNSLSDWDAANAFSLKSFTVSTVPLPAGGLLLASAMGGLAFMRRRRSSASAA